MKFLIWLGCLVAVTLVLALVTEMGFELGGVPTALLYMGGVTAGRALNAKLDGMRQVRQRGL